MKQSLGFAILNCKIYGGTFMEILRVENICKTYEMDNAPVHALSDVSFPSIKESLLQSLEHLGLASLPCCTF